jgi:hypothetical protein
MVLTTDTKVTTLHPSRDDAAGTATNVGVQNLARDSADWNRAALALSEQGVPLASQDLPGLSVSESLGSRVSALDWNALALSVARKQN